VIMAGGSALDIKEAGPARGRVGLRKAGLKKIMDGITSLDEIQPGDGGLRMGCGR